MALDYRSIIGGRHCPDYNLEGPSDIPRAQSTGKAGNTMDHRIHCFTDLLK